MAKQQELSGKIEQRGDRWWAYCDQYPTLAAHGSDQGEALANVMKVVNQYLEALEASAPKKTAPAKNVPSTSAPLRFTLQAA